MGKNMLIDVRKVIRAGNALAISLPKEWIDRNNVKVGQRVIVKVEIIDDAKDIEVIRETKIIRKGRELK